MHKLLTLTKRNILVYLRDRSAVFFSLLSMLITLMLMVVFLGEMNVEGITDLLEEYGGVRDITADRENALHLVQYWTMAGILVVNAVTVTLTVIGTMVSDSHENRLESFYSAPVSKTVIAVSYIASAIIIGFLFCMLTAAAGLAFVYLNGGELLSMRAIFKIMLYTLINVCIFSIIMYLAALCVRSSSAWAGIATLVGTLVGFLGAVYVPMGNLPEGVRAVLKCLPILHGASLMREICCKEALTQTFADMPEQLVSSYEEYMGISIVMKDNVVITGHSILLMLLWGAVALAAVIIVAGKKNISDR